MQQLQGIEEEEDEHHSNTNANTQEPTDPTDEAVNKCTHTHTHNMYIHVEVSGNSLCFINPRHIYIKWSPIMLIGTVLLSRSIHAACFSARSQVRVVKLQKEILWSR